jgi:hypothetical protein
MNQVWLVLCGYVAGTIVTLVASWVLSLCKDPGQVDGWDVYYRETERFSEPWGPEPHCEECGGGWVHKPNCKIQDRRSKL